MFVPRSGNMNLFNFTSKMEKLSLRWLDSDTCLLISCHWDVCTQNTVYNRSCSTIGKSTAPLGSGTLNFVWGNEMVLFRIRFFCLFPAILGLWSILRKEKWRKCHSLSQTKQNKTKISLGCQVLKMKIQEETRLVSQRRECFEWR